MTVHRLEDMQRWLLDVANKVNLPPAETFSALVEMCSLSFANMLHTQSKQDNPSYKFPPDAQKREERFMLIAAPFQKKKVPAGEFMGMLVLLMNQEPQDYLGQLFSLMELHNTYKGQFFTPSSISTLLAGCVLDVENVRQSLYDRSDFVTVNDPACGAGSTLIGMYQHVLQEAPDLAGNIVIYAEDIDIRCFHMCFTQLSALGLPAVVSHQNTLSMERWDTWYTYGYFASAIPMRERIKARRDKIPALRRDVRSRVLRDVQSYFKKEK